MSLGRSWNEQIEVPFPRGFFIARKKQISNRSFFKLVFGAMGLTSVCGSKCTNLPDFIRLFSCYQYSRGSRGTIDKWNPQKPSWLTRNLNVLIPIILFLFMTIIFCQLLRMLWAPYFGLWKVWGWVGGQGKFGKTIDGYILLRAKWFSQNMRLLTHCMPV